MNLCQEIILSTGYLAKINVFCLEPRELVALAKSLTQGYWMIDWLIEENKTNWPTDWLTDWESDWLGMAMWMFLHKLQMSEWVSEWVSEYTNCRRVSEWVSERASEWVNECVPDIKENSSTVCRQLCTSASSPPHLLHIALARPLCPSQRHVR